MKNISIFRTRFPVLSLIGLAIPVYLSAQDDLPAVPTDSNAHHQKPEVSDQKREMRNLERFLMLPSKKLAEMRRTIETIEKMSPEERNAMRRRLEEYKKMNPNMRQRLKKSMGDIPPESHRFLRRHFFLLTPENRKAEHNKINKMTPEKRRAYYLEVIEQMRRKHPERRPPPFKSQPSPSTSDDAGDHKRPVGEI